MMQTNWIGDLSRQYVLLNKMKLPLKEIKYIKNIDEWNSEEVVRNNGISVRYRSEELSGFVIRIMRCYEC